ncbi:MAG: hypothetical protein OXI87_22835 [Albidovulum sp.]|nr:hypothetical protein [Albidovulum sp.]MDE0307694.1 hypothetical protein [Albidovulum sp.]
MQEDYRWAQKFIVKSEIILDDGKLFHTRVVGKRDEALRGVELKAALKSTTQDQGFLQSPRRTSPPDATRLRRRGEKQRIDRNSFGSMAL